MRYPFQCLTHRLSETGQQVVVAATGATLHVFDVQLAQHVASWPEAGTGEASRYKARKDDEVEGPSKRPRLTKHGSDSSSAEIVLDTAPATAADHGCIFDQLVLTRRADFVVAITGVDKAVRVFRLDAAGLEQLSIRHMPKRPSALALDSDDTRILCADKFGDVYALPLHGKSEPIAEDVPAQPKYFVPSASTTTVHTKKNREALLQQQRMKKKSSPKKAPEFVRQHILGHVSLLTDIAVAQAENHEYIITADRDEHIRVSRGGSQAHIIEAYCLGHTQFVSRLCLLRDHPELLLSGDGDGTIILWNWLHGTIKQKLSTQDHLHILNPTAAQVTTAIVSGIHTVGHSILVSLEGVPAIFVFTLDATQIMTFSRTISLPGNVIALTILPNQNILCSLDTVHEPFTTDTVAKSPILQAIVCIPNIASVDDGQSTICSQTALTDVMQTCLAATSQMSMTDPPLSDHIYSRRTLKKRTEDSKIEHED